MMPIVTQMKHIQTALGFFAISIVRAGRYCRRRRAGFPRHAESRRRLWPFVLLAARAVAVDVAFADAGYNERVVLKVEHLRAVSF
jgi:hypothetical protein